MQTNGPLSVEARHGQYRCLRLADGRFHLVKPGPLTHLFSGSGFILASKSFAKPLRDMCSHCLDFRRTEVVQIATGESFGAYFEVLPHDQITPESIGKVSTTGFHAWGFDSNHLFISQAVADEIQKRGFDGITFSSGFTCFAGGTA